MQRQKLANWIAAMSAFSHSFNNAEIIQYIDAASKESPRLFVDKSRPKGHLRPGPTGQCAARREKAKRKNRARTQALQH